MTKNILTEENKEIVKAMAEKRASGDKYLQDDLFQEGCLALTRAVETFNPSLGVPFWGYAKKVVGHAMSKAARTINQTLSISLEEEYDVCPIVTIDVDEDFPQNDICDCEQPTPYEYYESTDTRAVIRGSVNQLPRKERVAVTMFYGLDGLYERPLECIGDELGCSVEGARKICARGVKKMRERLDSNQYNLWAA